MTQATTIPQSMVTIIAPLPLDRVEAVRVRIGSELGNPAVDAVCAAIKGTPGAAFVHFASLHALAGSDGKRGHLVLEFSADGSEPDVIAELAKRAGYLFLPLFTEASDWPGGTDIAAYWRSHQVKIGFGLFDTVGLAHCGTPGQTVEAILRECDLAETIAGLLSKQDPDKLPLERIRDARDQLAKLPNWGWALQPCPPPLNGPTEEASLGAKIGALALPFVTTFLWPLLILLVPFCAWLAWPGLWLWRLWPSPAHAPLGEWIAALKQVAGFLAATLALTAGITLVILTLVYLRFVKAEANDWLSDRNPDADELVKMVARENAPGFVQNHMLSQTVMKPGLIRMLTIRLAFFAVAKLTALNPRPGFLGDIGTIHFARWVTVPGTRDFLFFSNFGGSWESYLEDFITKAHAGLTAVWSNTVGFPRTSNLFFDGATDGERFKRYARQSMIHTPFWFNAYPHLTTANIRCNQLVRRGVSAAMTEAETVRWLALFGSAPRPIEKLETTQIQSLLFGGLGFKRDGRLVLVTLGDDIASNKAWLCELLKHVAFNDGRYATDDALITFAASASGLAKLGLDRAGLATFPPAFLQGMHGPGRERILGDIGDNARDHWWWGKDGNDIALLVYGDVPKDGETERAIDRLDRKIEAATQAHGGEIARRIELVTVAPQATDRKEPFGFVDGVSQPAMRGTYRGLRNDDPIHLVEPGEFVLGYPDNRGNVPPGPLLDALHDPGMVLPVAGTAQGFGEATADNPRLPGYNGSFLVIRQLEQHVDLFKQFCADAAGHLAKSFPDQPIERDVDHLAEFIGAKMIGRWKDGSSLVRNPYLSASRLKQLTGRDSGVKTARSETLPHDAAATPVKAAEPHEAPLPRSDAADQHDGEQKKVPAILPDNDFLFGTEDPQGLRCPYGAHVRRANPRDSLSPGSDEQIAISNRHRILRVGRGYVDDAGRKGLLFMCLNGDLERQFEFIQQTWMGSVKFHGLDREADPIVTDGMAGRNGFTIPTRGGPVALQGLKQFVTMRGGGYFFVPGRQLLRYLAQG